MERRIVLPHTILVNVVKIMNSIKSLGSKLALNRQAIALILLMIAGFVGNYCPTSWRTDLG